MATGRLGAHRIPLTDRLTIAPRRSAGRLSPPLERGRWSQRRRATAVTLVTVGSTAGRDTDAWSNTVITDDALPRLADVEFEPLAPAYLRLRTITAGITAAVAAVIAVVVIALAPATLTIVIAAGVTLLVWAGCLLQRLEVDRMGYAVREHDLSFRRGVLTRSVATVPFARVQHVSIGHGPLDRRFGLASLDVRTAGGAIGIPGLPQDTAERLKRLVTERAAELAQDEVEPDEIAVDEIEPDVPVSSPAGFEPPSPFPPPETPHDGR